MWYSQCSPETVMTIDFRVATVQSPMDLSSILNPYPTPPRSEDEMMIQEDDEMTDSSSDSELRRFHTPQPMEIDGEIPWFHRPSPAQVYSQLPPIQLAPEQQYSMPSHRTLSGPGYAQVLTLQRSCETVLISAARQTNTIHAPRHRHHCLSHRRSRLPPGYTRPSISFAVMRKKRNLTGTQSNRAYTQEQMHWLRYHRIDCDMHYHQMYAMWLRQFPQLEDRRGDGQQFSSRLYRDHRVPVMDDEGCPVYDAEGKPEYIYCKIRDKKDAEHKDIPFKLVEKHPEWAIYWDWVSPAHKAMAQKILDGKDLDFAQTKKEKYRRAILKLDPKTLPKGWYPTPAHHAEAMLKLCESQSENTASVAAGSVSSSQSTIPSSGWTGGAPQ
ncbi:hypothetical protein MBM_00407 [Drepanopeziza brunnea f. sp. 'multigermtubi' MB_m1]|uniref:Uncharacterized protein n=2 Tax=Drepanopeziza brunnea f. sp. 'multigermtubi' TaxID=698441 RepID=K1Y834_MARBU|nr:uncharacterized protein MBM_00407 [Drepanopeziza brunnea f. sp. 'multigermtubi' MB_m1]EKD21294.1 hypothetical protein MBM_00407 [Drepanopeziza brunnea f. sp. 'multigermtubi' MB_m1]